MTIKKENRIQFSTKNKTVNEQIFEFDQNLRENSEFLLCGIDEAGRGPLAGPVVAAAVILPFGCDLPGVRDSKKLSKKKRSEYFEMILESAISHGIGIVHERDIDKLNILNATHAAMKQALGKLNKKPDLVIVDGNPVPLRHVQCQNVIHGDSLSLCIAAASILAKVTRDKLMIEYAKIYPEYGFDKHMGYGTPGHLHCLKTNWATPIHRYSYKPVKPYLPSLEHFHNRNWLGKWGEKLASSALVKLGYEIIEVNYSVAGVGEIDIIHMEDDELVFSEVKSGFSGNNWGEPIDQIDSKKRDRILETADEYLSKKDYDVHVRFDVISVQFSGIIPRIKRIKRGLSVD